MKDRDKREIFRRRAQGRGYSSILVWARSVRYSPAQAIKAALDEIDRNALVLPAEDVLAIAKARMWALWDNLGGPLEPHGLKSQPVAGLGVDLIDPPPPYAEELDDMARIPY